MNTSNEDIKDKKEYPTPNGHKIELLEEIDAVKLRYIIEHAEEYKEELIKPDSDEDWTLEKVLTILNKFLRKVKKGRVKVSYKQSAGSSKTGRYFGQGLQGMPRVVRHTIAKEFYYDVDIKNAHPTFLEWYCRQKGLKCDKLTDYIEYREDYFTALKDFCDMDRDTAKSFMCAVINGKILEEGHPGHPPGHPGHPASEIEDIVDFYNELVLIRQSIMELNPDLVKLCKKKLKKDGKTEYNLDGSVVNMLMCDLENMVLMEMVNFFHNKKLSIDVLSFDGLMIHNKNITKEELLPLLSECEHYVLSETGISIKLDIKEMNEDIKIPEDGLTDNSYQAVKTQFEKHNFKCITPVGFFNVENGSIHTQNKADLISAYEHLQFLNEDGKETGFIRQWLKDPDMRKYKYVKCLPPPLKCPSNTYNLWKGFAISQIELKDVSEQDRLDFNFLLEHIKLLSNNDEPSYEYFIKWLACLFQKAGYKNNICIPFKSKQGIGKDLLYTMLENMIGSYFCGNIESAEHNVFGQFNSFLQDKVLVVLNEFSGSVGFKYDGKIKDMITRQYEPIRKMRTDLKDKTPSFCHYMMFTQKEFPVKIERGDRRFFPIEITQNIPDKEYFDRLASIVKENVNWNALRMLYNYLLAIEVSNVDWKNDRPFTEYMSDLMENSDDREMKFVIHKIQSCEEHKQEEWTIKASDYLQEFLNWNSQNFSTEYNTTAGKMGMKLRRYAIDGFTNERKHDGKHYTFNIQACIHWLIKEKHLHLHLHLSEDYLQLPEAEVVRLLQPQQDEEEVDWSPNNPHLPPM